MGLIHFIKTKKKEKKKSFPSKNILNPKSWATSLDVNTAEYDPCYHMSKIKCKFTKHLMININQLFFLYLHLIWKRCASYHVLLWWDLMFQCFWKWDWAWTPSCKILSLKTGFAIKLLHFKENPTAKRLWPRIFLNCQTLQLGSWSIHPFHHWADEPEWKETAVHMSQLIRFSLYLFALYLWTGKKSTTDFRKCPSGVVFFRLKLVIDFPRCTYVYDLCQTSISHINNTDLISKQIFPPFSSCSEV